MKILKRIAITIVVCVCVIVVSIPLWMLLVSSFLGAAEATNRIGMIFTGATNHQQQYASAIMWVQYPTMRHYLELLLDTPEYFVMFLNSVKQEILILGGQLLIGMPAAWAFARYEFKGRRVLFMIYVVLLVLPFQVTMVSSYLVLEKISLMNTMWAVVLPNIFSTFPVFIMTKFFKVIPEELLEAARLDGANELQLFCRVGLPIGRAGVLAAMMLCFLEYWNNVEQPVAFLQDKTKWPLSLYLFHIDTDNIGLAMVAAVISLIPAVLIFLAGQRYLEQGIVASGLKE